MTVAGLREGTLCSGQQAAASTRKRRCERGFALHQQLILLNEEFKAIKDRLKTEIDPFELRFAKIKMLTDDQFDTLFRKVTIYDAREKQAFRSQVTNLLKAKEAIQVIDLCSIPSEPKAVFKSRGGGREQA